MKPLCEYAKDKSIGMSINVVCSITNEFCGMVRYCSIEQKPVMSSSFYKYGCKIKNGEVMSKKKKSEIKTSVIEVLHTLEDSYIEGTVNYSKRGKTSIKYLSEDGNTYNIDVSGIYKDKVRIYYRDKLKSENIQKVEQL